MNTNSKTGIVTLLAQERRDLLDALALTGFEDGLARVGPTPKIREAAKAAFEAITALVVLLDGQTPRGKPDAKQKPLPGVENGAKDERTPPGPDLSTPAGIAAWAASQGGGRKVPQEGEHGGGMNETQDLAPADRESYEAYERENARERLPIPDQQGNHPEHDDACRCPVCAPPDGDHDAPEQDEAHRVKTYRDQFSPADFVPDRDENDAQADRVAAEHGAVLPGKSKRKAGK